VTEAPQGTTGGVAPDLAPGVALGATSGSASARRGGQRIGVFGGTFDPPHHGHLVAATNVRHDLALDRVLLVVANRPWQKEVQRAVTPAEHRLAMVAALVADRPGLEASDLELHRDGPTYTVDTLIELRTAGPDDELHLIVGEDAATGLPTWERIDEVLALARLVVVTRPGAEPQVDESWVHQRVAIPRLDISSHDLRDRVASGRPIDGLVPEAVASCITLRGLYRGSLL
jgi:nicotinate-nucleotide adenylyltransferase